jgi:hypothetical protein
MSMSDRGRDRDRDRANGDGDRHDRGKRQRVEEVRQNVRGSALAVAYEHPLKHNCCREKRTRNKHTCTSGYLFPPREQGQ